MSSVWAESVWTEESVLKNPPICCFVCHQFDFHENIGVFRMTPFFLSLFILMLYLDLKYSLITCFLKGITMVLPVSFALHKPLFHQYALVLNQYHLALLSDNLF